MSIDSIVGSNVSTSVTNGEGSLTYHGLVPATSYAIFMYAPGWTDSYNGSASVRVSTTFRTEGCRTVDMQLSIDTLAVNQIVKNWISLSVSAPVSAGQLEVVPLLSCWSSNSSSNFSASFYPSIATFLADTNPSVLTVPKLLSLSRGIEHESFCQLHFDLRGNSSEDYELRMPTRIIQVLSSQLTATAPKITTAAFSADGLTLVVSFDRDTDRGGFGADYFACHWLLSFACSSDSTCRWVNARQIHAHVSGDSHCAAPSDTIHVAVGANLRAACPSSLSSCNASAWLRASSSRNVTIVAPSASEAIVPYVQLAMPDTIGNCSVLYLDATLSNGHSGRSWQSASVMVTASGGASTSELQAYLSEHFVPTKPLSVPTRMMAVGSSTKLSFKVSLCNFLGFCGSASKIVSVIDADIPSLYVVGGSSRKLNRSQSLSVMTKLVGSSCPSPSPSRLSVRYQWFLTADDNSYEVALPISQSRNPSVYTLPPYSLSVGTEYQLRVVMTILGSSASTNATTRIIVQQGLLRACIRDGSQLVLRETQSKVIDGSCSYDEDEETPVFLFTWRCTQTSPVIGDCTQLINMTVFDRTSAASQVVLHALEVDSSSSKSLLLELLIQDASGTRQSSRSVSVELLPMSWGMDVELSLSGKANALGVMNPADKVGVSGALFLPPGFHGNYSWSIAPSTSLSSASSSIARSTGSERRMEYLSVPSSTLSAGLSYTFTLQVTGSVFGGSVMSAAASIDVTINDVPRLGNFVVSPASGVAFEEEFALMTFCWRSVNFPLMYQFSYTSISGAEVLLRPVAESSTTSLHLPPGDEMVAYNLTCTVTVIDTLSGTTKLSRVVQSYPSDHTNMSLERTATYLEDARIAVALYDIDLTAQASAAALYFLNAANCSVPTPCSTLNRKSCSRIAHTCGACLDGGYVGAAGDGNTYCSPMADATAPRPQPSTTQQTCLNSCFGHGSCRFYNAISGFPVDSCAWDAVDCFAKCDCSSDYSKNSDCSSTNEEVVDKQIQRSSLIEILSASYYLQSPSSEVVSSTLSMLTEASQRPEELSSEARSQLLHSLSTVVDDANKMSTINIDALVDVATVLDSVVKSASVEGSQSTSIFHVASLLSNYTSLIASDALLGEEAKAMQLDSFRILVDSIPLSSSSSDSCGNRSDAVTLPASNLEAVLGVLPRTLSFPLCPSRDDWDVPLSNSLSVAATSISLSAWSNASSGSSEATIASAAGVAGMVPGSFMTEALTLRFSAFPGSAASDRVVITMPLDQSYSGERARLGGEVYQHNCTAGSFDNVSFPCHTGNSSVSGACRGVREVIELRCPVLQAEPGCFFLSLFSSAESPIPVGVDVGCSVLNRTSAGLVCSCPLVAVEPSTVADRRFLLGNASYVRVPSGEVTVSYVGMLQVVTKSFANTVISVKTLNAQKIEDSVTAVVTLGVIVLSVLLALFFANRFDEEALRKVSSDGNKSSFGDRTKAQISKSVRALANRKIAVEGNQFRRIAAAGSKHQVIQHTYTNPIFAMAEEALPSILGAKSLWSRMLAELKRHHRWAGVVFFFSPQLPRLLRVVSLATNIIIMLFMQSITYNITKGDDGSCAAFQSETACLDPSSPYSPGSSKCYWMLDSDSNVSGECLFVQPDNDMQVVLFIAVFSAILSTPIGVATEWLVLHVLCAPLVDTKEDARRAQLQPARHSRRSLTLHADQQQHRDIAVVAANHDFVALSAQLREYHQHLDVEQHRKDFQGELSSMLWRV